MNIEITLSFQQLAGKLPLYIKGRKFWLLSEKQRQDLIRLKADARTNKENLQRLIDRISERKKK